MDRRVTILLLTVLAAPTLVHAQGPPPPSAATFQTIGDLPGGPFVSNVRDATKVGGVLYAVGASASHNQIVRPCEGWNEGQMFVVGDLGGSVLVVLLGPLTSRAGVVSGATERSRVRAGGAADKRPVRCLNNPDQVRD